ncbi:MAG: hypothetical protein M0010_02555 [Actinomycetota bacterium]|nr:hypothetical protein [Actinomycetota bacterium]
MGLIVPRRPSSLPRHFRQLLPWLRTWSTADEPRLVLIVAHDVELFERHIPELLIELDGAGPPFAELVRIVERARYLLADETPRVAEQHVVSQVLSTRFCLPARPGAGRQLASLDVRFPRSSVRLRTPRQVGKVTDFVPIDSEVTERLWKGEVEDHLHDALESVEHGTVFDHPEHVATIKTTIALHYARSLEIEEVHGRSWSDGLEAVVRQMLEADPSALARVVARRTRLELPPSAAIGLALEQLAADKTRAASAGLAFRLLVEDLFRRARAFVERSPLQIWTPAAGSFVLGDTPALTWGNGAVGIQGGVPFGEARSVSLPLGPGHLAAFGQVGGYGELTPEAVNEVNRWQIRQAQRYVYFHPDPATEEWVRRTIERERPNGGARATPSPTG